MHTFLPQQCLRIKKLFNIKFHQKVLGMLGTYYKVKNAIAYGDQNGP